VQTQEGDICS